jgi:hypothetical protein
VSRDQALAELEREIAARGVEVLTDADPEVARYLEARERAKGMAPGGIAACSIENVIIVREAFRRDVRTLREELIHMDQAAESPFGIGPDGVEGEAELELDARRRMVENAERWGLVDEVPALELEIELIRGGRWYR